MSSIRLVDFQIHGDHRGKLISLEAEKNVPFPVRRVYYIYATQQQVHRGFHAHRSLKQLAVAVHGSCTFLLDNGSNKQHIKLDNPTQGLLLEGLIWREMYDFSVDCVLMVLANEYYDEADYIRNYEDFLKEC